MKPKPEDPTGFVSLRTRFPDRVTVLKRIEFAAVAVATIAALLRHGIGLENAQDRLDLGAVVFLGLSLITGFLGTRYRWSLAQASFVRRHLPFLLVCGAWSTGILLILIFGPRIPDWTETPLSRAGAAVRLSEIGLCSYLFVGIITTMRRSTVASQNPALLLGASFLVLICIGTVLLMLPRCRLQSGNERVSAPFSTALFTATSASCVTGLTVEPTGSYWSPTGQTVILLLFQVGGLGMMTWGALFAMLIGGSLQIREISTFRDLLDSENLRSARQLLLTIFALTISIEIIGALTISGLWSDLPWYAQIRYSLFHSVSAFCNAGFSLHDDGFLGRGSEWQIWGPISLLIIAGGLGFPVILNLIKIARNRLLPQSVKTKAGRRAELTMASRLALISTLLLLLIGSFGFFILESTAVGPSQGHLPDRIADAWFQSVTFRTAGFHTVDHGQLQSATKFFAIPLMFVGACPGSTGGGIKTTNLALLVLVIASVLKGRNRVEYHQRTIPLRQISRSLTIIGTGIIILITGTLLVVVFENQPGRFIDLLFEPPVR